MALIKSVVFTDNYHKITSVEYHVEKEQLRIRTEVLKDRATKEPIGSDGMHQEYIVNEFNLREELLSVAEKTIVQSEIDKDVKTMAEGFEKEHDKKATKKDIDDFGKIVRNRHIARACKLLAENKIKAIKKDLNEKGILTVAYECLKLKEAFKGAVDC